MATPISARPLPKREFGRTALSVPALGLGAGEIGDPKIAENTVAAFLNSALDSGVTFIDTARMYGASEERIGRHISHRRREFVLSTKVGYDIPGHEDWTYGCVAAGVDAAMARLRTDYIDIVHLHSCPIDTLRRGEIVDALEAARRAGKIRLAAYSGENEALDFAIASGRFQSIQASVNVCEQRIIDTSLKAAATTGLGVIAKRPLANGPWRFSERPAGLYVEEYWLRWKAMGLDKKSFGFNWDELFLRFAGYLPGVHVCIAGTADINHLRRNIEAIQKGPLDPDIVSLLRESFASHDAGWTGQI